jgi:ribonuclease R
VLRALAGPGRPQLGRAAIGRRLGVDRGGERALGTLLEALVREGRIERVGRRYRLPRADGLVEGRLRDDASVVEEGGAVWRVPDSGGAEPGDRVLLQPSDPTRQRGDILDVLGGERTAWVGIFRDRGAGGVVTPYRDEPGADWRIPVARRDRAGALDGAVVVVERRRVVEVLGPPGMPEADFRAVVWRRRLPVAFPRSVQAAADAIPGALDPAEVARRIDLRSQPFVTIDPETARDHDDAVCVAEAPGGGARLWVAIADVSHFVAERDHDDAVCVAEAPGGGARLWVAIADVSHFVAEGSPIDVEALRRGNSVYFPDRAIPMLPERLSGDLCSLRPDAERLALVVELEFDATGAVKHRAFYPAVVRSRARLTYAEAAAAMETGESEQLRLLARLTERLTQRRFDAGSLDFDLPSAEIVLGDDAHPVDIVEAPRTRAHRAIEESMLAANRAVAEALAAAGVPAVFRNHEPPTPEDADALGDVLAAFGLPPDFGEALRRVAGRPEERLVHGIALRSMRQARYEAECRGHYALAFRHYVHFTSPIRRYADLVVHRALKVLLDGRGADASRERMPAMAARVSWRERVAVEAEREMIDLKKCVFMARRVGLQFDGTVSGVAPHGLYVTLDDWFVDGLVHVSKLPGYFEVDDRRFALTSRSGERFRLGDRMRVRVDAVDGVAGHINFSLVHRIASSRSISSSLL